MLDTRAFVPRELAVTHSLTHMMVQPSSLTKNVTEFVSMTECHTSQKPEWKISGPDEGYSWLTGCLCYSKAK